MEAVWVGASAPQRGTPGALNTPSEQGALVCSDLRISAKSLLIESKGRGWSRGLSLKMLAWCGHLPQPIVQGCKETKAPDSVPSRFFLSTVTPLKDYCGSHHPLPVLVDSVASTYICVLKVVLTAGRPGSWFYVASQNFSGAWHGPCLPEISWISKQPTGFPPWSLARVWCRFIPWDPRCDCILSSLYFQSQEVQIILGLC